MPKKNKTERLGKWLKAEMRGSKKAFVWDVFTIGIFMFVLFLAVPIAMNIGNYVTTATIQQCSACNASQIATLQATGNGFFNNTPDVVMAILYFMLILASFISASYEGANPAATLLLGLIFVVLATVVSFPIADSAHQYINFVQNLNAKAHLGISTYIQENLPILTGILTVAYIVFVISRKEVILEAVGGFGGGSPLRTVSQ